MKKIVISILFAIMAAPLIGYSADNSTTSPPQAIGDKKPLYWIDTMEPNIHYSGPGKSHMGMDLVPVYPDQKKLHDKTGANQ